MQNTFDFELFTLSSAWILGSLEPRGNAAPLYEIPFGKVLSTKLTKASKRRQVFIALLCMIFNCGIQKNYDKAYDSTTCKKKRN